MTAMALILDETVEYVRGIVLWRRFHNELIRRLTLRGPTRHQPALTVAMVMIGAHRLAESMAPLIEMLTPFQVIMQRVDIYAVQLKT